LTRLGPGRATPAWLGLFVGRGGAKGISFPLGQSRSGPGAPKSRRLRLSEKAFEKYALDFPAIKKTVAVRISKI